MNENAIKNFSFPRAREFFACALALALGAAVFVPLLAFGAGEWDGPLAGLRSSDRKTRAAAVKTLAEGGEAALPELLRWMNSSSRYGHAAEVGVAMGRPALPALIALLKDPELGGRAGEMLFRVARPEVVAELPEVLSCTKNPSLRDACGRALVQMMGPAGTRHRAALEEALKDGDPMVRAYAAAALGQLMAKGRAAVPALAGALKDPVPTVRWSAAVALGKIGKKAASAAPALLEASRDPEPEVARLAADALKRIRD